jgi:subtilisin-like proprotein convertase family protein
MRSEPSEVGSSKGNRARTRPAARREASRTAKRRRLALEGLEPRTLLATSPLPSPIVVPNSQRDLSANGNINESTPSIAVDKLNPNKVVAVWTVNDTQAPQVFVTGSYSNNGGVSWNPLPALPILNDPTKTSAPFQFPQVTDASVAFDRNDNFYILDSQHQTGNAIGVLALSKFNFSGNAPTTTFLNNTAYQWISTNPNDHFAIAPTLAVDDNVASFTDPTTGAVQTDTHAGNVYVAWQSFDATPQGATNWNPNRIVISASADGGQTFGAPVTVNSNGNSGPGREATPRLAVSQGRLAGGGLPAIPGGQVTVVWDDFGSQANANPPQDVIRAAPVTPGAGNALTVGTNVVVGTSFVRGSTANSYPFNYQTSAGVSAQGMGPAPVIASDDTLGSFSPHQGRLYVAFVDFPTGTPADYQAGDSDIRLYSSDDGGASWALLDSQLNSDNGATDGFSGAGFTSDPGKFIYGRTQFQPELAVDDATGTVVASWLDARYDAANVRVADFVTYSIDGGRTFSPQVYANQSQTATDAITNIPNGVVLGPIPENATVNADGTFGLGTHQGLAVYDGRVYPAFVSNLNGNTNGKMFQDIYAARVTIPDGPRVTGGSMGAVQTITVNVPTTFVASGSVTINAPAADGTPQASGFLVTFDRPIDPATFTASQVQVSFTGTTSPVTPTSVPVTLVAPVSSSASNGGYTQFVVTFQASQAVGAYSYVVGPAIADLVRTVTAGGAVVPGNRMDQNEDGIDGGGTDVFSAPTARTPTATPLAPGTLYQSDTLPLVLPGPSVVSTFVPGLGTAQVHDAVVSSIDVVFDRDMDPTSITAASILRVMGPTGLVPGPYTIAQDGNARTYRVGFAPQSLSGTYTVTLASSIRSKAGDALDTNKNAGVDLLVGNPGTSPTAPVTYTAAAPNVPTAIGPGTVTSTLTVPDNFIVQQGTQLQLNISYPNDPDLTVVLIAPNGTKVTLFSGVGTTNSPADFSNTTFDDSAATQIQNGAPPFFGKFTPQQPLSALNGINAAGTWTLQITDAGLSGGSLLGWSLTLQKAVPSSGLGELVADQATVGFSITNTAPSNVLAGASWTPVGPAPVSNGYAGQMSSIAVDPSDPSGNTVFAASASGGVWKTSNFLTTNTAGPTWIPLTDYGPTGSLNIGSIAVFGRNSNPNQSIVIAGTGFGDATFATNFGPTRGVGFLLSQDGGATWTLLDSTNNSLPAAQRDHIFAVNGGTTTFKVVVDPNPTPNGGVIIYAAMSGPNGGLWRSLDTGLHWQKMSDATEGNVATDVILDRASATVDAVSNPTGNVNVIYAAFPGHGVYISPNRGQTLNLMAGNTADPQIRDGNIVPPSTIPLANGGPFGGTGGDMITLATPALVPSTVPNADVENAIYQNWVYAAVADANGHLDGLYLTKDAGATWTKLDFTHVATNTVPYIAVPTNDQNAPIYDVLGDSEFLHADYNVGLAIDPTNPNIAYLGGTSIGQSSGLIRIDATGVYDSHAFVAFDNNRNDGGASENNTAGRIALKNPNNGIPSTAGGSNFVNLIQNPTVPFQVNTTVLVFNTASFSNDGTGLKWTPFDDALDGSTNIHQIYTMLDPVTGLPRLIVSDDQGIFTGVDSGGSLVTQIGTSTNLGGTAVASFSRNGNLQDMQYFYGSAQASDFAAQVARALYYGNGDHTGSGASDPSVQTDGNLVWTASAFGETDGVGVGASQQAVDPQGDTVVYRYLYPGLGGSFTNFFQVSINGGAFISRTTGLVQSTAGIDPQWPRESAAYPGGIVQGNFAVNPIDGNQVIISSNAGRIFSTVDQGKNWLVIGDPTSLDGSYAPALTYGAPDPTAPGGIGNLNNFIYAGTVNGHIFVTRTGGGGNGNQWTNISSGLDGSAVVKIVADPSRLSHAAYAVTLNGVYYTADSLAPVGPGGTVWTNITGNLFSIANTTFGQAGLAQQGSKATYLTSIQADWRYTIPNPSNPTHPFPVLFVSGNSGVYASLDNGATWSLFPSMALNSAPADGGFLPNVSVTDLTLSLGTVDPTTGRGQQTATVANPSGGTATATATDTLLATTFGRGSFQIRLAPLVIPGTASVASGDSGGLATDGSTIVTNAQATIRGVSEQTAFGNTVTVTLYDLTTDPNHTTPIGFGTTDSFGNFAITISPGAFQANGLHTLGIQASDSTGSRGNVLPFPITLNANNLTTNTPPQTPTLGLSTQSDSSGGLKITNVTQPTIVGTTTPGVQVQLFMSDGTNTVGAALATASSDAGGNYSLQFPAVLADGPYTIQVLAKNIINGLTSLSPAYSFTIKSHGPTTAPSLSILAADDTGVAGDGITSARRPHLVGTADPGAIVDVYSASNPTVALAETAADPVTGAYSLQLPGNLSNGTVSLVVQARDVANNKGPTGAPFPLTITTVAGDFNNSGKAQPAVFQRTSPASWLIPGVTAAAGTPFGVGGLDIPLLGDFLGTGQDQLAIYRTSTATWYAAGAFPASGVPFGWAGVDEPVPADYLGTGRAGLAVYRPTTGEWFIAGMASPTAFGGPGDIPVPGDYDNTGHAQLAVYRPSTGEFFILGHAAPIQLGTPGEVPVPGQYDNTATSHATEPAVYDPTTGVMTILGPGGVARTVQFTPGSIPAPGNYDGVAGDEPAAYDPTTGTLTIAGATTHTVKVGGPGSVPVEAPLGYRKPPVPGDFVGTGQAQLGLFRPSTGQWFVGATGVNALGQLAVTNLAVAGVPFGSGATDIPLLADFAGTGHDQLAVYRTSNSTWYAQGGLPNAGVPFGGPGDIPVPGNYDGTGATEIAVYRPSTGQWFIAGHAQPIAFGGPGDIPMPGNYDGTGTTEIAVYRPSTAQWFIAGHAQPISFGWAGVDIPVPAGYDSNGITNIAVYRPTTGQWFIAGHAQPVAFGGPGDIPVAADFDGVNHAEIAVYRPSTGQWFIAGHAQPVAFGGLGDIPAVAPLSYRVQALQSVIALSATGTGPASSSSQVASASSQVVTASASPSSSATRAAATTTTIATASSSSSRRPNQAATKGSGATLHDVALSELYGGLRRRRRKA